MLVLDDAETGERLAKAAVCRLNIEGSPLTAQRSTFPSITATAPAIGSEPCVQGRRGLDDGDRQVQDERDTVSVVSGRVDGINPRRAGSVDQLGRVPHCRRDRAYRRSRGVCPGGRCRGTPGLPSVRPSPVADHLNVLLWGSLLIFVCCMFVVAWGTY